MRHPSTPWVATTPWGGPAAQTPQRRSTPEPEAGSTFAPSSDRIASASACASTKRPSTRSVAEQLASSSRRRFGGTLTGERPAFGLLADLHEGPSQCRLFGSWHGTRQLGNSTPWRWQRSYGRKKIVRRLHPRESVITQRPRVFRRARAGRCEPPRTTSRPSGQVRNRGHRLRRTRRPRGRKRWKGGCAYRRSDLRLAPSPLPSAKLATHTIARTTAAIHNRWIAKPAPNRISTKRANRSIAIDRCLSSSFGAGRRHAS